MYLIMLISDYDSVKNEKKFAAKEEKQVGLKEKSKQKRPKREKVCH